MLNWFRCWATTLRIMIFERDLYRSLREPIDMDDFVDAPRPETYR
jgi:hypothetical protein